MAPNTNSFSVVSQLSASLADNVTVNSRGEVIASVGDPSDGVTPPRIGINVYEVTSAGQLQLKKSFCTGTGRWVVGYGRPRDDSTQGLFCTP